jgi:hypothetical protein
MVTINEGNIKEILNGCLIISLLQAGHMPVCLLAAHEASHSAQVQARPTAKTK